MVCINRVFSTVSPPRWLARAICSHVIWFGTLPRGLQSVNTREFRGVGCRRVAAATPTDAPARGTVGRAAHGPRHMGRITWATSHGPEFEAPIGDVHS